MKQYFLVISIITLIIVSITLYKVFNLSKSNYQYDYKYKNNNNNNNNNNNINLFHWNIHFECFSNKCNVTAESCPQAAIGFITKSLADRSIDFAHFIDLENQQQLVLPPGYTMINPYSNSTKCGYDYNCIVYNSNSWTPVSQPYIRCMEQPPEFSSANRITIIQQFKNKFTNLLIWVIGAHFGHPSTTESWDTVLAGLKNIILKLPIKQTDNIILLADTNASYDTDTESNDYIMKGVLPFNVNKINGSTPYKSCCFNDMNDEKTTFSPFRWKSDRIISNFGKSMTVDTQWLNSDTSYFYNQINIPASCRVLNPPTQPAIAEMHKPVFATLSI